MTADTAVENPIINSPFVEPQCYWEIKKGEQPKTVAGRREAYYYYRVPDSAKRGRKNKDQLSLEGDLGVGQKEELHIANWLRKRLKEWRNGSLTGIPYDGASDITKELLRLWKAEEGRFQRLFFAQVEAAETIIFLTEAHPVYYKSMPLIPVDQPGEKTKAAGFKSFTRYACKMATGTGKTTVMGMLSAWTILNRVAFPTDNRFTDTILIVCPNVTIRERLKELDPALGDQSIYRTRQLVPPHRMEELRRGEVMVTNWHKLAKKETNSVNGDSAKVVKTGEAVEITKNAGKKNESTETKYVESDAAWFKRNKQELGSGKGRCPYWLVFNDEAHHAYRRGDASDNEGEAITLDETASEDRSTLAKKNDKEATIWIEGLDRINRMAGKNKQAGARGDRGINLCVDLSATPFYIQGSGNEVGKPFPWVVSDFGLLDAIESGLVKIPQLPSRDISGNEEANYFNIWRWVEEQAFKDGIAKSAKDLTPEVVLRYASAPILIQASDWHQRFQQWMATEKAELHPVPPVFIIVCRDTKLAAEVYEWLANDKGNYGTSPDYFRNRSGEEKTVRIDSKVMEDMEEGTGSDEVKRLRFILDTVGKKTWAGGKVPEEYADIVRKNNEKAASDDNDGSTVFMDDKVPPGRDIRCIISVAMLAEGWDANTVTHIVGLRPFGSQLLCEQVVGRALRRRYYTLEEGTDRFGEESARVFGVPFELIPLKVSQPGTSPPKPDPTHIFSVPEKQRYQITFPMVSGYFMQEEAAVSVDYARIQQVTLDPTEINDSVELTSMTVPEGHLAVYGPGEKPVLTLADWRKQFGRDQMVAFKIASKVCQHWQKERVQSVNDAAAQATLQDLFPQVLLATKRLLQDREKLICKGTTQPCDVLLAGKYQMSVVDALYQAIAFGDASNHELPRIPKGEAGRGSTEHVDFHTYKPTYAANKCHINLLVADTKKWEQSTGFALDTHAGVVKWVKNEHLNFAIPYRKEGIPARYIPDFIAVLDNGLNLILETKGRYLDDADRKAKAAQRWVDAVNRTQQYGQWAYSVVRDPTGLPKILDELAAGKWVVEMPVSDTTLF